MKRHFGAHMPVAIVSVIAVIDASASLDPTKPEALLAAERARLAITTARLEWCVRDEHSTGGFERIRYREWRAAGADIISINRGDEEGVVLRDMEGKPASYTYNGPIHALLKNGDLWEHTQDSLSAELWDSDSRQRFNAFDMRRVGLNPANPDVPIEEVFAKHGYPPLEYETRSEDGCVVVTGRNRDGGFRWWIDPKRGHSIIRTEVELHGKTIGRTEYQVKAIDGVWFPVRSEHWRLSGGDVRPSRIIEIAAAEFNRPEHAKSFTQADIGIEVGTHVNPVNRLGPSGVWDGAKIITPDEYDWRTRMPSNPVRFGNPIGNDTPENSSRNTS